MDRVGGLPQAVAVTRGLLCDPEAVATFAEWSGSILAASSVLVDGSVAGRAAMSVRPFQFVATAGGGEQPRHAPRPFMLPCRVPPPQQPMQLGSTKQISCGPHHLALDDGEAHPDVGSEALCDDPVPNGDGGSASDDAELLSIWPPRVGLLALVSPQQLLSVRRPPPAARAGRAVI